MNCTVVISTKNRLEPLTACLESLRRQSRRPEELVIVDAGGEEAVRGRLERFKEDFPEISYHHYPSSLPQARNFAIERSRGEAVVFLDDDLVLEPDFLAELLAPLEEDPTLAGVCGDILNHERDGELFKKAFKLVFQLPHDGDGRFRRSGAPTMTYGLAEGREVEFLPGGLTAWRREVFGEFLFDPTLPGLGVNEDVDFSYRVSRKWRNYYTPRAKVRHFRPEPQREARFGYLRQELRSHWYLYRKNHPRDPLTFLAVAMHSLGILMRYTFRLAKQLRGGRA